MNQSKQENMFPLIEPPSRHFHKLMNYVFQLENNYCWKILQHHYFHIYLN